MDDDHHFDAVTNYCTRCGQSELVIAQRELQCASGNVVAISHRVRLRGINLPLAERMIAAADAINEAP